jgi:CcmD family protein
MSRTDNLLCYDFCQTTDNRQQITEKYISMKNLFLTICLILSFSAISFAQSTSGVEMATELRSSGKIYVVVAVIAVIFIGIAIYLFSIDNRLKKIERQKL